MAKAVTFDAATIREIYAHAQAAERHRISFEQRAEIYGEDNWGDPQPDEETKATPSLILVKDRGVYFMSSGVPHLPNPDNPEASFVAYAHGLDPRVGDPGEQYNEARAIFGGDDFACHFPLTDFEKAMADEEVKQLRVRVTKRDFVLGWSKTPPPPEAEPSDDPGPSP